MSKTTGGGKPFNIFRYLAYMRFFDKIIMGMGKHIQKSSEATEKMIKQFGRYSNFQLIGAGLLLASYTKQNRMVKLMTQNYADLAKQQERFLKSLKKGGGLKAGQTWDQLFASATGMKHKKFSKLLSKTAQDILKTWKATSNFVSEIDNLGRKYWRRKGPQGKGFGKNIKPETVLADLFKDLHINTVKHLEDFFKQMQKSIEEEVDIAHMRLAQKPGRFANKAVTNIFYAMADSVAVYSKNLSNKMIDWINTPKFQKINFAKIARQQRKQPPKGQPPPQIQPPPPITCLNCGRTISLAHFKHFNGYCPVCARIRNPSYFQKQKPQGPTYPPAPLHSSVFGYPHWQKKKQPKIPPIHPYAMGNLFPEPSTVTKFHRNKGRFMESFVNIRNDQEQWQRDYDKRVSKSPKIVDTLSGEIEQIRLQNEIKSSKHMTIEALDTLLKGLKSSLKQIEEASKPIVEAPPKVEDLLTDFTVDTTRFRKGQIEGTDIYTPKGELLKDILKNITDTMPDIFKKKLGKLLSIGLGIDLRTAVEKRKEKEERKKKKEEKKEGSFKGLKGIKPIKKKGVYGLDPGEYVLGRQLALRMGLVYATHGRILEPHDNDSVVSGVENESRANRVLNLRRRLNMAIWGYGDRPKSGYMAGLEDREAAFKFRKLIKRYGSTKLGKHLQDFMRRPMLPAEYTKSDFPLIGQHEWDLIQLLELAESVRKYNADKLRKEAEGKGTHINKREEWFESFKDKPNMSSQATGTGILPPRDLDDDDLELFKLTSQHFYEDMHDKAKDREKHIQVGITDLLRKIIRLPKKELAETVEITKNVGKGFVPLGIRKMREDRDDRYYHSNVEQLVDMQQYIDNYGVPWKGLFGRFQTVWNTIKPHKSNLMKTDLTDSMRKAKRRSRRRPIGQAKLPQSFGKGLRGLNLGKVPYSGYHKLHKGERVMTEDQWNSLPLDQQKWLMGKEVVRKREGALGIWSYMRDTGMADTEVRSSSLWGTREDRDRRYKATHKRVENVPGDPTSGSYEVRLKGKERRDALTKLKEEEAEEGITRRTMAGDVLSALPRAFGAVGSFIATPFKKFGKVVQERFPKFTKAMQGLTKATGYFGLIKLVEVFQQLWQAMNPFKVIMEALQEIFTVYGEILSASFMPLIQKLFEVFFGDTAMKLITTLADLFLKLAEALMPIVDALMPAFYGILEGLQPIIGAITKIMEPLLPIFTMLGNIFGQIFSALGPVVGILIQALVPALKIFGFIMWLLGNTIILIMKAIIAIINLFKRPGNKIEAPQFVQRPNMGGGLSTAGPQGGVETYQHGGIAREPTIGLLGERRPEAVVPLDAYGNIERGKEGLIGSSSSGGGGVVLNVYGDIRGKHNVSDITQELWLYEVRNKRRFR